MQGVSRTSLQDIARRAGATRGAVYWHFKDKADLFNAMMERVTLPMEQCLGLHDTRVVPEAAPPGHAIDQIRDATLDALQRIVNDEQTRRVFEVATHKVEYVEELQAVRQRHITIRNSFVSQIQQSMQTAAGEKNFALPVSPITAAHGLHSLISGLIQNWLLDPDDFDLLDTGRHALDVYLRGLGFEAATA